MKETESTSQTPEQLMRLLDVQLDAQRARRKKPERNRVAFLVSSVLIIMAGAAVALMILEQMLVDSPREGKRVPQSGAVSDKKM
jgi:hypothetical protein